MLKIAVEAQLPLVAVFTRDILNLPEVLKELTGQTPVKWGSQNASIEKSTLYYFVFPKGLPKNQVPDLDALYEKMVKKESTLLAVNPPVVTDAMFNGGEIPVPRQLMLKFMATVTDDTKKAEELLLGLGGVTIKEAAELARLTMARDKSLTAQGLMLTRKQFFQSQPGLNLVDPHQLFYAPDDKLAAWIKKEHTFFLHEKDDRLVPRGLLFDGPPGVGKTSGAKFIAEQWGVPLYRVDIGGTKNKWLGESEANWLANLSRLDNEEPCIALFDEIEKAFSVQHGHGDSGTTTTMLSQLLWWLAEHRSRVLTIMTTNDAKKLPRELYRERRIDKVMTFKGLMHDEAKPFVEQLAKTFGKKIDKAVWGEAFEPMFTDNDPVSHAALTEAVYGWVKAQSAKG